MLPQKRNRRRFLGELALGASTLLLAAHFQPASASEQVIVQVGTGDWAQSMVEAYVKPFEEETGIEVVIVNDWGDANKLKLWHENGAAEWDVTFVTGVDALRAARAGHLQPIDYSVHDANILENFEEVAKGEFGVGVLAYSVVLAYYKDQFSGAAPQNWAEFWDVEKFPGKRTLPHPQTQQGPWYLAALADGVPPDQLYPLDVDRAFASLEKIRPHIVKWWQNGSENQQIFADRIADLGAAYNGRIGNLQKEGLPIEIEWSQGELEMDFWVVPSYAQNAANAQKFIAFTTRAKRQADLFTRIPYGPTNALAYDYLDEETAAMLPNNPTLASKQFYRDYNWEAEIGPDGKTNYEVLLDRWNRFILDD